MICEKLRYYSRLKVHEFKFSSAVRFTKWRGQPRYAPPDLSEDIKGLLADEFRINPKIRIFGHLMGRDFFILWLDPDHKHRG